MDVWAAFRSQFETDDGSLPEVQLHDLGATGVLAVCQHLTEIGEVDAGFPGVWDAKENCDRGDISFLEAARGVVEHRFEAFHWTISRIRIAQAELPQLGVFVFDDSVYLDYRMGFGWNAATLNAFLELLELLLSVAPSSRLVPDRTIPDPDAFMKSWTAFALERSSLKSRTA